MLSVYPTNSHSGSVEQERGLNPVIGSSHYSADYFTPRTNMSPLGLVVQIAVLFPLTLSHHDAVAYPGEPSFIQILSHSETF